MDLYLVTGISYLFTSICLKVNENHDVPGDLVIVDHFAHVEEYRQRLEQAGLFRHVDVVSKAEFAAWERRRQTRNKLMGYMELLRSLLLRKYPGLAMRKYRAHAFAKGRYDRCYSPGKMPAFLWFQLYQIKKCRCRIYFFDAGVATRCGHELPGPGDEPRTFRLARKFGCLFLEDHMEGRYYFNQTGVNPAYGKPLQQILPSAENVELARVIRQVFDYDPQSDTMFQRGTLFFHQCFDTYPAFHAFVDVQHDLWNRVLALEPDARICPHPRTRERYDEAVVFSDSNGIATFDVRCMFAKNMDSVTLCSCYSTALFVPKLTFGKEPYLVFLYWLLQTDTIVNMTMEQWDRLIDRSLRACYSDPSKIYIPRSMEEFQACLDEIDRRKAADRLAAAKAREGEQ